MIDGQTPTRTVYVVRHAIAQERGTPGVADDDRRLTAEGHRKFREVARRLAKLGDVHADRIVTSPLPRADETATILARALGLESRLVRDAALAADQSAESIRDWLLARPESRLAIVGHNPALSQLVSLLLTGSTDHGGFELRKGGIACLSCLDPAAWRLEWFARPRILRRRPPGRSGKARKSERK